MQTDNKIVDLQHISKIFHPPLSVTQLIKRQAKKQVSITALDDISFSLETGKILCVLGPNGSGKTTLLKILATILLPDTGTLTINGLCPKTQEYLVKSFIGFAGDSERSFYWRLSGQQNLIFFAALYGLSPKNIIPTIEKFSELFNINYLNRRFDTYSAGMKKKLTIMRAFLHKPDLIILDEPFRDLDYASRLRFCNFIKNDLTAKQNKTVIFSTHLMDDESDTADKLLILNKSRLCGCATLEVLRKKINNANAKAKDIFIAMTGENKAC